jgi:hypothetical protein
MSGRLAGKSAGDTNCEAPYAGFMNLQVPRELEAKLMRVRWTTDAADDLERICDDIAESRPESA